MNMILYLACLVVLAMDSRASAISAILFLDWAVTVACQIANGGYPPLPAFIAADFAAGVALAVLIGSKPARWAALFFLPMIALSAVAYLQGGPPPQWRDAYANILCWGQAFVVAWGVWGHGLGAWLDHLRRSGSNRRALVSHNSVHHEGSQT